MDRKDTAIEVVPQQTALVQNHTFGAQMALTSLAEASAFADVLLESGMAPKGMNKAGCVIAMQLGAEVGLSVMQSVQNIANINGRPAIWGDAQLALVRKSGLMETFTEAEVGERGGDTCGYTVTVKRVGQEPASDTFTVADAKRAGLWEKQGPWRQYPQRMLKFRARGFVLRDQFGDVLKGLRSVEEARDIPREVNVTDVGTDKTVEETKQATDFMADIKAAAEKTKPKPDPVVEPPKPEPKPKPDPVKPTASVEEVVAALGGAPPELILQFFKVCVKDIKETTEFPGVSTLALAPTAKRLCALSAEQRGYIVRPNVAAMLKAELAAWADRVAKEA